MNVPASPHFTAVDLGPAFNADRDGLPEPLRPRPAAEWTFGAQTLQGIPFLLGTAQAPNVVLLDQAPVTIELDQAQATYLVFLHAVETRVSVYLPGFADQQPDGNELGDHVSDYILEYADGTSAATAIARRFAIQQSRIQWGASPFEAVPARAPAVFITPAEARAIGRLADGVPGSSIERTASGRDQGGEQLWLYALPNPQPRKPIRRLTLAPRHERSVVYGLAYTALPDHPLRPGLRQKLRLELPAGASLNKLGQFEGVAVDLGSVISASQALEYDPAEWAGRAPNAQPVPAPAAVVVEYAAHPAARLFVSSGTGPPICYDLSKASVQASEIVAIAPARRPVRLRVVERGSPRPVPARLHLHGAAGEYLPPRGHHRQMSGYWFDDNYAEFRNGRNAYSYIPGECVVDLPLGEVFVEATRGYEVLPVRRSLTVTPETDEITLELERALPWRQAGWVTADTHVHFISPQTAWLEGAAEGVNVVNLLASQWGELFTNVGDFDGRSTLGAKDFGGDGEFLVRVGTENRMQVLGHISLLGYDGPMIQPLCTGGPSEAALGDPQEVAMAEWAAQCIAQNGLVVMPHAPNPQCERAADIVLGLVHAIELMTFNPFDRQIDPYGLADWYRYLNLGYQLPVVGGSDKMSAASLLGGVRTYAHLGEREFTYANWKAAVRAGNTFATVGPLAQLQVEGQPPGGQVWLPPGGGTLNVTWKVESVSLPIEQVEIVVGGRVAEQVTPGAASQPAVGGQVAGQVTPGAASQPAVGGRVAEQVTPGAASQPAVGAYTVSGSAQLRVTESTWVALRVRGSYRGQPGDIAAHTSVVRVLVGARPIFSEPDAASVLAQIEGALRYVDTIAPRPEATRYGQLRGTLLNAHRLMHERLHQAGVQHHRGPVHSHFHE